MTNIDGFLLVASTLLLSGVILSKLSGRFGLPALLLFLLIGMLAGADGIGGIYFDNYLAAQSIGVVALALILFDGGLSTDVNSVKKVFWMGFGLSTIGVVLTSVAVSLCAMWLLDFSWLEALLLGAIVSSTDAAAVFSILRSKSAALKGNSQELLEFESGSNDPMAVFLTIGILTLMQDASASWFSLTIMFFQQLILGLIFGYFGSRLLIFLINKIRLSYDGLYPVMTISFVLLIYSACSGLGGSGFLAAYLSGLLMSRHDFIHKSSLIRFHDGIAWMMQIGMFLTLGLLVFPSDLAAVAIAGSILAIFLMFIGRPLAVLITMLPFRMPIREKLMVSWVGLRGATPIILSTFPLIAGIPNADTLFNMVFFIVLISIVLQGSSIPWVAKRLQVFQSLPPSRRPLLEWNRPEASGQELKEFHIPPSSKIVDHAVVDLGLPANTLIVMVTRGSQHFVPRGETVIEPNDSLLIIYNKHFHSELMTALGLT